MLLRNDVIGMKWQRIQKRRGAGSIRNGPGLVARPDGPVPGSPTETGRRFPSQSDPRFGLQDCQQIPDVQITVELDLLFVRQHKRASSSLLNTRALGFSLAHF
jgi:hypothetical protein